MVQVTIRPPTWEDSSRLMKWRNTPFIYNRGFSGAPVDQKSHREWFTTMMSSKFINVYIIEANGIPCGMVKFHSFWNTKETIISIYIAEKFTGKGIGADAIRLGCAEVLKIADYPIVAEFLDGNIYSKKAFRKAGFRSDGKNRMKYIP